MNNMTTDSRSAPWNAESYTYCECGVVMDVEYDDYEKEITYTCPECGELYII